MIGLSKRLKKQIRVNRTKKEALDALGISEDEGRCFTVDGDVKLFQTIAMKNITFKNLKRISESDKEYERIIGIKLVDPKGIDSKIKKMTKGKVTILTVPCNDHCSFQELVDFVQLVEPTEIIPTANFKEATQCIAKYFK